MYEDLYCELAKFGHLLELHVSLLLWWTCYHAANDVSQVCDNVGDHLIGNVYARYEWETEAQAAVDNLNDRWYAGEFWNMHTIVSCFCSDTVASGRPLYAELSPVTDFREACCRQNENGECNRGGFCNFMHLRLASKDLVKSLQAGQRLERRLHPPQTTGGGGWEPSKREGRQRSASPRKGRNDGEDRWTRK